MGRPIRRSVIERSFTIIVVAMPMACGSNSAQPGGNGEGPPGSAPPACDGRGGSVPNGFPALGMNGCAAHVVFTGPSSTEHLLGEHGAQPVGSGAYDLDVSPPPPRSGARATATFRRVGIRLPSLAPATYELGACAVLRGVMERDLRTYGTDEGGSDQRAFVRIEVAGAGSGTVWGHFEARACALTERKYILGQFVSTYECMDAREGRFAARVEGTGPAEVLRPPAIRACRGAPGSGLMGGTLIASFSSASGSNATASSFSASAVVGDWSERGRIASVDALSQTGACTRYLAFLLRGQPTSGRSYTLDGNRFAEDLGDAIYAEEDCGPGPRKEWHALDGGTVAITALERSSATFSIAGARMKVRSPDTGPPNAASGTFTIDGRGEMIPLTGL